MEFKTIVRSILIVNILLTSFHMAGQCPDALFSSPASACIGESVQILDQSTNSEAVTYDLCSGDLQSNVSSSQISTVSGTGGVANFNIEKDGDDWIAFLSSRNSNVIHRLNFGNSFDNVPVAEPLGNIGGLLSGPETIKLIQQDLDWYGFVVNSNNSELVRLSFGSSLTNTPTAISLGDFTVLDGPRGIDIQNDDGDWVAVITNFDNEITVLNFGTDITNATPTHLHSSQLPNATAGITSVSIHKECDQYYGLVTGWNTDRKYRLSFGTDLYSIPTVEDITAILPTINNAGRVKVQVEGGEVMALIIGFDQNIHLLNFGTSILNPPNYSLAHTLSGNPDTYSLGLVTENSVWRMFTLPFLGGRLIRLDFENNCPVANPLVSTPDFISTDFASDGTFRISQHVMNLNNEPDWSFNTITIFPQVAPLISFTSENICINSLITFDPSNTGLTSYDWDFDGDGMVDVSDATGASQSFDYSSLGTGTYTVRLDVSDGTCNNFFEQEITIYDPPPAPSYSFTSPRTCKNTDYTFTNETLDGSYVGPLEYLWEFIDETTSTVVATAITRDVVYAFAEAGLKTVRLTSSIPGCTEVTEQSLTITEGPNADFSVSSACQNEAMQFTNQSTGAVSYSWDFGDGFLSSAENPSHIFNGAGNFSVSLTATDAEGCTDTEVIPVLVSDSPQISFDFDIPCTAADGIQFFDLTIVDNADLVSWSWFVDDVEVSNLQSPQIIFESTGVKNIRLDVQSSNGCESSFNEDIDVLASPTPDFNVNLGCQGETSVFTDNTTASGNPIVSWLWTVEGVNYTTQDINHVFTSAGTFDVVLEVTGQNFCSETITKSVEVIELPAVDFSISGECDNQLIRAVDQSTNTADPVVARRWTLDGMSVGNGSQVILSDLEDNTYELGLELETQAGCIVSSTQSIVINDAPQAAFTSSRTFGIPDDRLTFTNAPIDGISYQWLLDGELRSTDPESESIIFGSAGTFNVSLVAQNSSGCYDTATQEVLIAIPEVDLSIGSFELVNENNVGKIFLEVQNSGNLPVESVEARIVLENTFAITEQIVGFIDVGESTLVSLNAGIPLSVTEPSYFCVTLISPYDADYEDLSPVNNEKCITIEPIIEIEDPFPNPVTDQFRLKLVSNESGTTSISLFNSSGKLEISSIREVSSGLNNYFIDMSILNPGIYYLVVDVLGTTHKRKIIKL